LSIHEECLGGANQLICRWGYMRIYHLIIALQLILVLALSPIIDAGTSPITQELFKIIQANLQKNIRPEIVEYGGKKYAVTYSINKSLQEKAENILKRFRSYETHVVILDNTNGHILASSGFKGDSQKFDELLPINSKQPGASLAKIITSMSLIDNGYMDPDSMIRYKGKTKTLYKSQINDDSEVSRWSKDTSLTEAFARSNNPAIARAAISNLQYEDFGMMAQKLGVGRILLDELETVASQYFDPTDDYEFAEAASGYTKKTLFTALQGSMLSMVTANNGTWTNPKMILQISDIDSGKVIWKKENIQYNAISQQSSLKMRELMNATVSYGTARKAFKRFKQMDFVGGKTGHLTGDFPAGKRDWFTFYYNDGDRNYSICALIINQKRWFVKSSHLVRMLMEETNRSL